MSRHEVDREDLLREATRLRQRIKLRIEGSDAEIVVGFREKGAASIFWGHDPVFQFNVDHQWRRGFRQGHLLKADHGRIAELRRQRQDGQVQLLRRDLNADETDAYLADMSTRLTRLQESLSRDAFTILGQVPEGVNLVERTLTWIDRLGSPIEIAESPRVG